VPLFVGLQSFAVIIVLTRLAETPPSKGSLLGFHAQVIPCSPFTCHLVKHCVFLFLPTHLNHTSYAAFSSMVAALNSSCACCRSPDKSSRNMKHLCILMTSLILFVLFTDIFDGRVEHISSLIGNVQARRHTEAGFKTSGTSGSLFSMKASRTYRENRVQELSSWSSEGASLSSAPLQDSDGQPFPICAFWAVITSINPPTKTVEQLAAMPDTCVCVVADKKSPVNYGISNVVYLTPEMQV